uniref:Uncharacterized protein n=1 Tax=Parascaris univalens TaxID=6257 RepID=A0A915A3D7_PARUN
MWTPIVNTCRVKTYLLNRTDINASAAVKDLITEYRRLDNLKHDNLMVEDSNVIQALPQFRTNRIASSRTNTEPSLRRSEIRQRQEGHPYLRNDRSSQRYTTGWLYYGHHVGSTQACTSSGNANSQTTHALSAEAEVTKKFTAPAIGDSTTRGPTKDASAISWTVFSALRRRWMRNNARSSSPRYRRILSSIPSGHIIGYHSHIKGFVEAARTACPLSAMKQVELQRGLSRRLRMVSTA